MSTREIDELNGRLSALRHQMTRAIRCGLNKIIEPSVDEETQDRIRIDIDILVRARSCVATVLDAKAPNPVRLAAFAADMAVWFENHVAAGGLSWMGGADHLSAEHFSPHQH